MQSFEFEFALFEAFDTPVSAASSEYEPILKIFAIDFKFSAVQSILSHRKNFINERNREMKTSGFVKIEKASKNDAAIILDIQRKAFMSEAELYNDYNISPLTQTLDELIKDFDSYIFLKAIDNGKITGSVKAAVHDNACWIGRLIVLPECQNQGIGRKLMNAVENYFPDAAKYELCTGGKSVRNINFYQKLGYRISGEEKENNIALARMVKIRLTDNLRKQEAKIEIHDKLNVN